MPGDAAFRMTVEDVFFIKGRGTVVTGRVEMGTVTEGDIVEIRGPQIVRQTHVRGIEAFQKRLTQAGVGEAIGILLSDLSKDDVHRGDVLAGTGLWR